MTKVHVYVLNRLMSQQQKAGGPRGSQTSLPRAAAEVTRERPASAYIPQKQDVNGPQHPHVSHVDFEHFLLCIGLFDFYEYDIRHYVY